MGEDIYWDMGEKGLISFPDWLTRAIEQKHPRLSVYLIHSELLFLDPLDAVLGTEWDYGEFAFSEN